MAEVLFFRGLIGLMLFLICLIIYKIVSPYLKVLCFKINENEKDVLKELDKDCECDNKCKDECKCNTDKKGDKTAK